ncbi:LPS assembly outer membrane protein LptD (organic solvent tolerance protein OstA) [Lutibacter maritimus]|uniref:LPS assembly outer membrane protein LptD (Organic solvent tolerance protein OstA) n=1 Tax=Lutibacter maritimus TaxID=593133 RepID=A0A1I6S1I6_9FLAO|nr:LPS assembly outer membrane protein LptD (organic solvent tolerance protein OstA) [Lutibacter maritimus]
MLSNQFKKYFYKNFIIKTNSKNTTLLIYLILANCFISSTIYSQEIKQTIKDNSELKLSDTIFIKNDSVIIPKNDSINLKAKDSLIASKPKDSLKKPKELLESIIEHSADSLIRQDIKNNKITLYKNAHIHYKDIDLTAGFIEIDNKTNIVTAKGIKDSVGVYTELPVFKQGSQESTQDTIKFNFKSEKAKIWNLKTDQQGIIIKGEVSKKHNDSVIFIENIKLTSSQKDDPDYYIRVKKAKFIKDQKLVAGASQLVIADVPTPVILPFVYVPMTQGRTSGFLMPTWGENNRQGYFLQNGGYYFVLSDNFDLAILGDIYTNGSWGLRTESGYAVRYKFSGNFDFRYENLINSLKGLDDYAKTSNYNIRWSHSQDQKASPNSRFSASVNLGSSKYYKESNNEYNTNSFLNNTLSSSISFYKKFVGTPFNMSLSVTHSQNTNTEQISMTLPSLQVNMDRIYPFVGKGGAKNNALQKTGLTYSMKGDNKINTTDEFFFKKEMFDEAKSGIQHSLALNTNMKVLKYFTLSPNVNYKEVWYFDRLKKTFDDAENAVVTDTISSFSSFREYSTALSLSTTFYGMFKFKKGSKIEAIRHVVRPSVSYSYRPDFSFYNEEVQKTADPNNTIEYSPFSNGIYGSPGTGISNSLNFSLNNNLEAKVRSKDSTETESKKIILLNNLNFSTSYNMAADSLKWSPVSVNAGTNLFDNKLSVNANATLDPYAIDANGKKINTFNFDNNGSLFRLTNAGLTLNYSLASKSGKKTKTDSQKKADANNSEGVFGESSIASNQQTPAGESSEEVKETKLFGAEIPWSLKIAYSLNYSNSARQKEISSNSLMFSGDLDLTPKWKVGFSSGYDIKNQGFTYTQLRFSRDLDSWKLNFNWVPFGDRQTYYFFIGVKSSMLSDLKYDKRQQPDRRLF